MILLRFREKIPLRIAEWLGGLAMVLIGLYLVIWPTAFQRAGLSGFSAIAPVGVWVGASLVLGAARIGALVLNGHQPAISAPIRCVVAVMGVGLFSSIAAGYAMATNQHGPPMAMLLALVLMAGDVFNAGRAGADTYQAIRSRPWTGFSH
ncbi:MAG: hypothetical protein KIT02_10230 [Devosia sp.]|uniref:hypothetical protein n=1 Tax=Devosia sp. TaxID=1871048 RepID=UPI0024CA5B91|nr:hypothetical protein [Devosia sp.]UYN98343.1 MAG: hypothetical protein KIT02_10230 [Devosia sp.]